MDCDRTGHFRAEVIGKGVKEMDSGAVSIALHVRLTEIWDEATESWQPWGDYDMQAYGDVWVVGKGGKLSDKNVQRLVRCLGWDGSFASINDDWQPTSCQVEIAHEQYQGKSYYKIAWVNGYDDTPGGSGNIGNADEAKIKALEARFGAPIRALTANAKRPTVPAAASGKPPSPPKPPAPVPAGADDGSIPF